MAKSLVLYTAIHTALPPRLPAIPAPAGAKHEDLERCLFDLHAVEVAFREAIGPAYGPALGELAGLAEQGAPLSVSVSGGFLEQSRLWYPDLVRATRHLLRRPAVEPIVTDPECGFLFAFDISRFAETMAGARQDLERLASRPARAAEVSGFCINHEIYHALARSGISAIAAEGEAPVTEGRHPSHLGRWGGGPVVLYRLRWLSDELSHQLRSGAHDAEKLADTIASLPGEAALVSFDLDALAFGAKGPAAGVGQLGLLIEACMARDVEPLTISEVAARFGGLAADHAPPAMTAMSGLGIEDFGRDGWTERLLFGRMQQAYEMGRVIGQRGVLRTADRLTQRLNLSVPRLAVDHGSRPPSFWRMRWWTTSPSYNDTAREMLAVYDNFIRAATWYAREEITT